MKGDKQYMNKLLKRIATTLLGFAMAAGVGVCVSGKDKISVHADTATIKHSVSKNTNMTGNNDAATFGLDTSDWSIVAYKGSNNNYPGLNSGDKTIRLYGSTSNANYITVTSLNNYTISSITISYVANYGGGIVKVGSSTISESSGSYAINSSSFSVYHHKNSTTQVRFTQIEMTYSTGSGTTPLATPTNLSANGTTMTWDDVDHESGYSYSIVNTSTSVETTGSLNANTTTLDVSTLSLSDGTYTFRIKADGDGSTYTDSNYTSTVNFTISSVTTYTVTYNGNGNTGGNVPLDNNAYESNDTVTVLGNTGSLVKTGSSFGGWNTNDAGTGTTYSAGATFSITGNVTLYAKWIPDSEEDFTFGDTLTTTIIGVTDNSYTAFSDVSVNNGSGAVYLGTVARNNTSSTYSIQMTSGSPKGIGSSTSGGYIRRIGVVYSTAASNTNNRYLDVRVSNEPFTSENIQSNGTATTQAIKYATGEVGDVYSITGNYRYVSIYASAAMYFKSISFEWEALPKRTVTYNKNTTDSVTDLPDPVSVEIGSSYTLSTSKVTRSGYVFKGWSTSSGDDNIGDKVTSLTVNGNTTVYAIWKVAHTVTFNTDGGSSIESIEVEHGTAIGTLPAPTKTNYEFNGWVISNTSTSVTSATIVNDDLSLTAQWLATYSVTNNISNATISSNARVPHGSALNITISPAAHYSLPSSITVEMGGAPTNAFTYNSSTGAFSIVSVTGNIVLSGSCDEDAKYTITYQSGDGSTSSDYVVNNVYGGSYSLVSFATSGFVAKSGYEFKAWKISTTEYNPGDSISLSSNITVVAVYNQVVTWNLRNASYDSQTASTTSVTWKSNFANVLLEKNTSSTNANNYLGNGSRETRVYQNQILSFKPKAGITISSIVITTTSTTYASNLSGYTWTNGSASASSSVVTVTPTDGTKDVSVTIGGATYLNEIRIYYTSAAAVSITSTFNYLKLVGDTDTVLAEVANPTASVGSITYESTDTDVATIDSSSGEVTAVGVGTTTINATAANAEPASFELRVLSEHTGLTINDPLTAEEALNFADCLTGDDLQVDYYYHGVITEDLGDGYFVIDSSDVQISSLTYAEGFTSDMMIEGREITFKGKLQTNYADYTFNNMEILDIQLPELVSISFDSECDMTDKTYSSLDSSWDVDGLIVNADYEDSTSINVTGFVEWSFSVGSPTMVNFASNETEKEFSLTITASYNGETASKSITVTVTNDGMIIQTFDGGYNLITDEANLNEGDVIIIGSSAQGKVMGPITGTNKYAGQGTASFADNKASNVSGALEFTLEESDTEGYWHLKNGTKYLNGTSSKNTLALSDTAVDISISISSNNATIGFGGDSCRILHNVKDSRFSNYTSDTSVSMLLPQIYRKTGVYLVKNTDNLVTAIDTFNTNFTCDATGVTFDSSHWTSTAFAALVALKDDYQLNKIVENSGGNKIEQFLATYDYVVRKYGTDYDYLGRFSTGGIHAGSRPNVNPLTNIIGQNTNTVAILVIISMVSMTAIGGYFFLRRRKENI